MLTWCRHVGKPTFGCVVSVPSATRFCTMSATCQSTCCRHVGSNISCLSFGGSGRHADIRHLPTKNFDKELMVDHELNQFPNFLRLLISSCCGFSQKSSTYNNLVAMAATVACNYNNTNGYTRRGYGPESVFMNSRVHHYMRIASSTTQNCGYHISYLMTLHHLQAPLKDKMWTPLYCQIFARVLRMKIHIAMIYVFLA